MTNEFDFWVVSINSPVVTPLKPFAEKRTDIKQSFNGTKMIYKPYRKIVNRYLYSLNVAYVDVCDGREKLNEVVENFKKKITHDSRLYVHTSYIARD